MKLSIAVIGVQSRTLPLCMALAMLKFYLLHFLLFARASFAQSAVCLKADETAVNDAERLAISYDVRLYTPSGQDYLE